MTTKIELRRMTFYAYHGVAPQETRVGNTFIVDLILTAPLENAVASYHHYQPSRNVHKEP